MNCSLCVATQTGHMVVSVCKNNQSIMFNVEWKEDKGLQRFTYTVVLELIGGDGIHLVLPSGLSLTAPSLAPPSSCCKDVV